MVTRAEKRGTLTLNPYPRTGRRRSASRHCIRVHSSRKARHGVDDLMSGERELLEWRTQHRPHLPPWATCRPPDDCHAEPNTALSPGRDASRNVDFAVDGRKVHGTFPTRTDMSQAFELDFDFGSPEREPSLPPAGGGAPTPTAVKPTPIEADDADMPDEDELLAMMEQDAQANYARDVENLEAMRRREEEKMAAAARRRAAIFGTLGQSEPLNDITNTPPQAQAPTQEVTSTVQSNVKESMFEADFDFGEPSTVAPVASCESSSHEVHS